MHEMRSSPGAIRFLGATFEAIIQPSGYEMCSRAARAFVPFSDVLADHDATIGGPAATLHSTSKVFRAPTTITQEVVMARFWWLVLVLRSVCAGEMVRGSDRRKAGGTGARNGVAGGRRRHRDRLGVSNADRAHRCKARHPRQSADDGERGRHLARGPRRNGHVGADHRHRRDHRRTHGDHPRAIRPGEHSRAGAAARRPLKKRLLGGAASSFLGHGQAPTRPGTS